MVKMLENHKVTDIRGYVRHLWVLYVPNKSVFIKHFYKTRFKRKPGLRDFLSVTEESLKSGFDCRLLVRQQHILLPKFYEFVLFLIPKYPEIDPGFRFINPESRDWKSSPETTIPSNNMSQQSQDLTWWFFSIIDLIKFFRNAEKSSSRFSRMTR